MSTSTLSRADRIAEAAKKIYSGKIQEQAEAAHRGEYLVIDIDSGDYSVAPTEDEALESIELRRPEGTYYLLRVGYKASLFMGRLGSSARYGQR